MTNFNTYRLLYGDFILKDKCGIIGIYSKDPEKDVSTSIYYGLYALQHRGQESSGITTCGHFGVNHHYGMGLVTDVFSKAKLDEMKGNVGIGHVRYSTVGGAVLENSEPFITDLDYGFIAVAHNGDIVNHNELKQYLIKKGYLFRSTTDSEIICYLLKEECMKGIGHLEAIDNVAAKLEGAYSLSILINNKLYVVRDPMCMKPLVFGELDDAYVFASESVAFDVIGAELIRDLEPGEVCYIEDGKVKSHFLPNKAPKLAHCTFEYVYFARPDSVIDGQSVYSVRLRIGEKLYEEYPVDADLVIAVPDSSIPAAIGYARASGIPFGEGLIKNRYVGRTFIMPTQKERELAVKLKVNPMNSEIKGKRIVVVDDSIVRGTTSESLIKILKDAGAKEVHMMIGCPPVIGPCYYGVAMATKEELIANHYTIEEIRQKIGADTLGFISGEGLIEAIGLGDKDICTGCTTDEYPTEIPEGLIPESYEKILRIK